MNLTPGDTESRSSSRTRDASGLEVGGQPLGDRPLLAPGLAGDDDVDVGRRHLARPAQTEVVARQLGDGGDGAGHADAVGAHRHGDLLAVGVEHLEVEGLGVAPAELEDVPDLDAPGGLQR